MVLRRIWALLFLVFAVAVLQGISHGAVFISEFVAENDSGLRDEDGETSDWIELYNPDFSSVSLKGYYLTDDPRNLTKWIFPDVTVDSGGSIVVFASGKNRNGSQPFHTSFSLDPDGEYLALVAPDGATPVDEFSPTYPPQLRDRSYGPSQTLSGSLLVAPTNRAEVLIPPASYAGGLDWTQPGFNPAGWTAATNSLGYEALVPGFRVRYIQAFRQVSSLAIAEEILTNRVVQGPSSIVTAPFINYLNNGAVGNYTNDMTFPGEVIGIDADDFVLEATGFVTLPAGTINFGLVRDDGFSLSVGPFTMSAPGLGAGEVIQSYNFPSAGEYPIRLVSFERNGGGNVEMWAGQSPITNWTALFYKLVGDAPNGGYAVRSLPPELSYTPFLKTDLRSAMHGRNSSAFIRFPFNFSDSASVARLRLRMKFDDGFVAYLNGEEVARRHAPSTLSPTAASVAHRANGPAAIAETIDLSGKASLLKAGLNVLAIHALNASASDSDFFIQAELEAGSVVDGEPVYLLTESPGGPNGIEIHPFVQPLKLSHPHGFYRTNFSLTLSTPTPGVSIRYTTNGSIPTATTGTAYSAPITISKTTILRAAAFKAGFAPAPVETASFIYTKDVVLQPATAPAGWPAARGPGAGQIYDYGMDPDIVKSAPYKNTITNDLLTIPSISLVMQIPDLFDGTTGIYSNPGGDGPGWERPASIELLLPNGGKGFQIDAGARLRGGFSRSPDNPKHGFRFFFRKNYGPTKLVYPLGGAHGASEYKKIDLRTFNNYSWAFQNDPNAIFLRDVMCRDLQRDMGHPSEQGDYYHLYINGYYWGLFNICERAEANFAAYHFGGDSEDYDVVKVSGDDGYIIYSTDGNLAAWRRLYDQLSVSPNPMTSDENYFKVQGLNLDGSRNPAYENLIDVDNLIDYMLVVFYSGNNDAPISAPLSNNSPNNFFAYRHQGGLSGGFKFIAHDSEHTFADVNRDRTGPYAAGDPTPGGTGGGFPKSNPQYFFQQLGTNTEFRLRVADHVQKHFFNRGVLTPFGVRERFLKRIAEIDRAVVGESARWGDAKREPPFRREDWQIAVNGVLDGFVNGRTAVVLGQLRADGMYPSIFAPTFSQLGGIVPSGYELEISNPNPSGILYYTVDGSDPRLRGGAVAASAKTVAGKLLIQRITTVKARVLEGATWSALTEARFVPKLDYSGLTLTEVMYNPPSNQNVSGDELEFVEIKNNGSGTLDLSGARFTEGIKFEFPLGTTLAPGKFLVLARNPEAIKQKYPALEVAGTYTNRLSNNSDTVRLKDPADDTIFEFSYSDESPWPATADGNGFSLVPKNPLTIETVNSLSGWRASAQGGGSPGRDDPTPASIAPIVINEVLTSSGLNASDLIELHNPTDSPVMVGGWFLTDDPNLPRKYRIPTSTEIPAKGFLIFDESDFGSGSSGFSFNALGDSAYVFSGNVNLELTGYSHGFRFGAAEFSVPFARHLNSVGEENFPPESSATFGAENAAPKVGPVVFSEIQYQPKPGQDEFIELRNNSDVKVDLFDPIFRTNTWRIKGVDFVFPTDVAIQPNGLLIISSIAPSVFRTKYGVPPSVPVVGPFTGELQNSGERLELQHPLSPVTSGSSRVVPYATMDEVRYNDRLPWPTGPAGFGPSLQRDNFAAYGNDPANWYGSGATVGKTNLVNRPPSITLLSPSDRSRLVVPGAIDLAAHAVDPDGSITRVDFYADGTLLGSVSKAPYRLVWSTSTPGHYKVKARAVDSGLAVSESETTEIDLMAGPSELGKPVAGYQDDFNGSSLSSVWMKQGADVYSVANGVLRVATATNDPNHLLLNLPGYNRSVQEVLVRMRVTQFGADDLARGGIATAVESNGQGLNYLFRNEGVNERHTEFLSDGRAWGPELPFAWQNAVWYWVRLRHDPNSAGQTADVFAKIWAADGETAEPVNWASTYDYTPSQAARTGLAGITASSNGGVADFEIDYFLIKAEGLPNITVRPGVFEAAPVILDPPTSVTFNAGQNARMEVAITGAVPLSFQWQKEGVDVLGQTDPVLFLTNAQPTHSGNYRVVVANVFGQVTSTAALLTVIDVNPDSDGDGLPNAWETQFNLSPNDASGDNGALGDPDLDRVNNRAEFLSGTDPRDPLSHLRILSIADRGATGRLLLFTCVSGRKYRLQFTESLLNPVWVDRAEFNATATGESVLTDTAPATRGYYRIVTAGLD